MIDSDVSDPNPTGSRADAMTGAQASYLKTLSEEYEEPQGFQTNLTKAEASSIDALKSKRNAMRDS